MLELIQRVEDLYPLVSGGLSYFPQFSPVELIRRVETIKCCGTLVSLYKVRQTPNPKILDYVTYREKFKDEKPQNKLIYVYIYRGYKKTRTSYKKINCRRSGNRYFFKEFLHKK